MDHPVLVYTTWPSADEAEASGRSLVERKLAACVNILPGMLSIFAWRGGTETAREVVMIVKTRRERLELVMDALKQLHPYETPSILALPVIAANPAYARWIDAETTDGA
jgi:periplasmic divalent cation tolerance protein